MFQWEGTVWYRGGGGRRIRELDPQMSCAGVTDVTGRRVAWVRARSTTRNSLAVGTVLGANGRVVGESTYAVCFTTGVRATKTTTAAGYESWKWDQTFLGLARAGEATAQDAYEGEECRLEQWLPACVRDDA